MQLFLKCISILQKSYEFSIRNFVNLYPEANISILINKLELQFFCYWKTRRKESREWVGMPSFGLDLQHCNRMWNTHKLLCWTHEDRLRWKYSQWTWLSIDAWMNLNGNKKFFVNKCPPLSRITLGRHKSDNNNRMIQLTDVFCALFISNWGSHIWLQ